MILPPSHIFAGAPARAAGNHEAFLNGRVVLHCGDCINVMATLPENSVDSVVCDPPYHLTSIVKRFSEMGPNDKKLKMGRINPFQRTAVGFMNQKWDGGDIAFQPETWASVYRVLKPGGHLLAFGGARTYHRLVCAIEDAGFEVRDCIVWLYGSGFPKSLDVSKAIDQRLGAEREVIGTNPNHRAVSGVQYEGIYAGGNTGSSSITAPATDLAAQWSGWGTALKPALEPICLARKPLSEGTIAANVLKWGTGALNIDGSRIAGAWSTWKRNDGSIAEGGAMAFSEQEHKRNPESSLGRWPANLIHDGSDEVVAAFPESVSGGGDKHGKKPSTFMASTDREQFRGTSNGGDSGSAARFFASFNGRDGEASAERRYGGYGGDIPPGRRREGVEASRLFYTSKADGDDRLGSRHPTVKPLDLMQYLVRLVTPKGGTVLDPFAGTGTTGEAAFREGMRAVLIEREAEYQADIRRRMALVLAGPDERSRESVKASGKIDEPGPLFAWKEAQ